MQDIINYPEFSSWVEQAAYSRRKFRADAPGVQYKEATNADIIALISGEKESRTTPDNQIDLLTTLDNLGSGTVGFVNPPNPLITTNTDFFESWKKKNDFLSLAAHWMHEWIHVAGFRHVEIEGKPDRNYVPYTIGKIVVAVGRLFMEENEKMLPTAALAISDLGQGYLAGCRRHAPQ